MLVRAGELRCRRGFEGDDWAAALVSNGATQADIVLSERPAPYRRQRLPILWPRLPEAEDHTPAD